MKFGTQEVETMKAADVLVRLCHTASVDAGWWKNAKTGDDYLALVRDDASRFGKALLGEKLALIHSEVSEALEGVRKGKMDEHLPHRTSEEVELADAIIRICDYAGARRLDLGAAIVEKMHYNSVRPDHKIENRAAEGGKVF